MLKYATGPIEGVVPTYVVIWPLSAPVRAILQQQRRAWWPDDTNADAVAMECPELGRFVTHDGCLR
jgi:hypothetical protein